MRLLRRFLLFLLLLMLVRPALAESDHVTLSARLLPEDARAGESAQIVVTMTIDEGWHTYSLTPIPDGPSTTTLKLTPGNTLTADGNPVQPAPKVIFDTGFNKNVEEYEHAVAFGLPVKINPGLSGKQKAEVEFRYQVCEKLCLPPKTVRIPVEFTVAPGAARPDHLAFVTKIPVQPPGSEQQANAPAGKSTSVSSGGSDHIMWSVRLLPEDARAGERAQIVVTVTLEEGWHTYSLTPIEGPSPTTLKLSPGNTLTADGNPVQPAPKVLLDPGFKKNIEEYEHAVAFGMPVKIKPGLTGKQQVEVEYHYQICDAGGCLAPKTVKIPVEFTVTSGEARPDHLASVTAVPVQPPGYIKPENPSVTPSVTGPAADGQPKAGPGDAFTKSIEESKKRGLIFFLLLAFGAGFLALLTPCVFPMVPITVSFFSKRKDDERGKGVRDALAYCLGIVGTYTVLGLLMTAIFGPLGIQKLAGNVWVNLGLAALFIVLAVNLFGVFEITVPTWLLNSAQSGRQKGGIIGPMMMGFAFTLTSFTCTVAFVGTLLASAAQGDWFYPTVGMLAFSMAFASPFFFLALFPQYLAKMPKSGSWLVSVKAFMGFLELAAALKFISNVDFAWQWGFLTRPVFLAVWASIGLVAGLYLLGWLQLPHDDAKKIGWPRRILGIMTALTGIYCLAAINGAYLGPMSAFPPPESYHGRSASNRGADPYLYSLDEALKKAKAENKPIFIDFTGYYCSNCRLMESSVFPVPEVVKELKNYIQVQLYTDRPNPEEEKNQRLQLQMTGVPTLPVYVTLSPEGKKTEVFQSPLFDSPAFVQFLKRGK